MSTKSYKLYGATMSPFSMKMRSYMRYRRIPFQWVADSRANEVAMTKVETYMVPVLENPKGEFRNDSTFLIDELETLVLERRSDPEDEADAFLSCLIEDYVDEWLVLPMFMQRWRHEADRLVNSKWILYEFLAGQTSAPEFENLAQGWSDRQVQLVADICGSEEMYGILDASLDALLSITERAFTSGMFLFGSRPSRADFALYGILSQLTLDASASPYLRENYNFSYRWATVMEDLSGTEGQWEALSTDAEKVRLSPIPDLLKMCAKYHLPLLRANTAAMDAGETMLSFEIDGATFTRGVMKRYLHCLPQLRKRYHGLSDEARARLAPLLDETGCLEAFQ